MNQALITTHAAPRAWLAQLDPRVKIAWLAAISLCSVAVDTWPELLGLCAVASLPLLAVRWSWQSVVMLSGMIGLTLWTSALSQGVFYKSDTPGTIIRLPWMILSTEGMLYGLQQALRFVATVVAGALTVISTSPERLVAALVWLRMPTAVAFVTVSALRWLPTLIDEWSALRRARRLRDGGVRDGWLRTWLAEFTLIVPLAASSLRRAAILATSVTARGFEPDRPRTFYPRLQMTGWEIGLTLAIAWSCAAVCLVKLA